MAKNKTSNVTVDGVARYDFPYFVPIEEGDEVTLTFEGADEDAAYEAVSKFMQETL